MKFATLTGVVLVLAFLHADEATQSEPQLLDLNVIALDSRGHAVTDLTADDFQITDAGKPQKISLFRRSGAGGRPDQAALGPHEFSNRTRGGPQRATVILFDLLNLGFGARGTAASLMERDLPRMEFADSLFLYLVSVDGRLYPIRDIRPPAEPDDQPSATPWTQQIKPLLDGALRAVTRTRPPDIDVFVRTQLTFNVLEALGARLAALPGRKNVIWVTDGVPVALGEKRSDTGEPVDFTPQIRQLSETLDRSEVALYPVRQIMMGRPDDIGATSGGDGATGGAGTGEQSIATLDLFAGLTGGRQGTDKDINAAIQQSIRDLDFSYQLGYYPSAGNWDDKFHKLRVTTKRKGLHVQAKTGYYAWKTAPGSRTHDAFAATANAAFDAAEIGLRATITADAANRNAGRLALRIDAQDIALAQEGDRYTDQLRVMTVAYLPDGQMASGPMKPLDIQYTAAEREQALKNGIAVVENLTAGHGEIRFRVIVFDRGSNAVGSVTIPADTFQVESRPGGPGR